MRFQSVGLLVLSLIPALACDAAWMRSYFSADLLLHTTPGPAAQSERHENFPTRREDKLVSTQGLLIFRRDLLTPANDEGAAWVDVINDDTRIPSWWRSTASIHLMDDVRTDTWANKFGFGRFAFIQPTRPGVFRNSRGFYIPYWIPGAILLIPIALGVQHLRQEARSKKLAIKDRDSSPAAANPAQPRAD